LAEIAKEIDRLEEELTPDEEAALAAMSSEEQARVDALDDRLSAQEAILSIPLSNLRNRTSTGISDLWLRISKR
jgi:hypothetical protein